MKKLFKIIMMLLLSLATGSCDKLFVEEPGINPESIFENLWKTFEQEYALFEERGIDWQKEYYKYRPLVTPQSTEAELHNILTQMLSILDDGHVSLTAPGKEVFFSNNFRRNKTGWELFNLDIIKSNYLEGDYKEGNADNYLYGKIKDRNLGYIHFGHIGENFMNLHDFLIKYETADGLIFDLRHNSGGDFTWSFSNIGRLTDEKRFVFRSKTKNGTGINDYTSWKNWYFIPKDKYVDKPLIVLIDRYTISAAERTVMAFKTLPNVTFVGDTTNGAHGTLIGRELANGWYYSLVPQKVELFDGKSYEGIGISPDIKVSNDLIELQKGNDKVLKTAIEQFE